MEIEQTNLQMTPIPQGMDIAMHMENWMRKQRIQIIRKERSRWRNEKKKIAKAITVGFAPRFPPEISSIIASFIRVPLTKKSTDELEEMIPKYHKLSRAYHTAEYRRWCNSLSL